VVFRLPTRGRSPSRNSRIRYRYRGQSGKSTPTIQLNSSKSASPQFTHVQKYRPGTFYRQEISPTQWGRSDAIKKVNRNRARLSNLPCRLRHWTQVLMFRLDSCGLNVEKWKRMGNKNTFLLLSQYWLHHCRHRPHHHHWFLQKHPKKIQTTEPKR